MHLFSHLCSHLHLFVESNTLGFSKRIVHFHQGIGIVDATRYLSMFHTYFLPDANRISTIYRENGECCVDFDVLPTSIFFSETKVLLQCSAQLNHRECMPRPMAHASPQILTQMITWNQVTDRRILHLSSEMTNTGLAMDLDTAVIHQTGEQET